MSNELVSMTTRPPRPGEVNGVHYYFVDDATFDSTEMAASFATTPSIAGSVIGRYGVPVYELKQLNKDIPIVGFLGRSSAGKTSAENSFKSSHNILSVISAGYVSDLLKAANSQGLTTKLIVFLASRDIRKHRMILRGDSQENIARRFMIEDDEGEYDFNVIGLNLGSVPVYFVNAEEDEESILKQVSEILS